MVKFFREHPFATVMMVAALVRIIAVVYSKGFMASDDHFQTVTVAYDWYLHGIGGCDGFLHWKNAPASTISRFPLYTLALDANMKIAHWFGAGTLDQLMYFVRARLALLSLFGVAAVYGIVLLGTGSKKWAMAAGLIMAAHFAMPFLAVRTLIEMAGGTVWVAGLFCYYYYKKQKTETWLILFGVLTGIAFMFRFELIFAFWIVPFMLWWQDRKLRAAVVYAATVLAMLIIAGLIDWYLIGTFMGSSINHVNQGLTEGPVYHSNFLLYIEVILAFFIPPLSLVAVIAACSKRFWNKHKVLIGSSLAFILVHTAIASRQERYMLPIVPAFAALLVLALYEHFSANGWLARSRKLFIGLVSFTVIVNLVLLVPLTINYGHKGLVEPLVKIQQMDRHKPGVLFVTPERYINFPYMYGGLGMTRRGYVYEWNQLDAAVAADTVKEAFNKYYLMYPIKPEELPEYVDSIESRFGPIEPVFHVGPSTVDWILHLLNPKFNHTNECWVYRRVKGEIPVD